MSGITGNRERQLWEYVTHSERGEGGLDGEQLSLYGDDGWELCGIIPHAKLFTTKKTEEISGYSVVAGTVYIFKRPK